MAAPTAQTEAILRKKPARRRLAEIVDACTTCRNRSVRCDKQKPECQTCVRSGRMCLGYTSKEVVASASASRQLFDLPEKANDRRALDFFVSCASAHLSGWLEEGFWNRTVLQLSNKQPAIRHALIAVSSAYEQESLGQPTDNAPIFLHYNKAIQYLYQQKSGSPQSALIHLSTCLLFTCLEFVHGDSKAAMAHVVSGLHILHAFKNNFDNAPNHHQPDIQTIHEDLAPMFCRLSVFSNLIGEVTPTIHLKSTDSDDLDCRFKSLSEARDGLTDLMNDGMRFVWSITPAKYTGALSTADIIQQVRLELRTSKWWRRFSLMRSHLQATTTTTSSSPHHDSQTTQQGLSILEAHFYMAQTFISLLTANSECAWDPYFPEFDKIVSIADDLINVEASSSSFTFEAELVGPLYLAALKCRHARTRRRAVALLERLRRREGVIDSRRAGRVARAIIRIEEGGLDSDIPPAERRRVQFFFEPEVDPANGGGGGGSRPLRGSSGPYSIAYKTCEGMFLKTRLEEDGPGEAVDVRSRVGGGGGARDDAAGGYKEFDIATTRFSQRL